MKTNALLVFLTLILFVPNFLNRDINHNETFNHKERYIPELHAIKSINELEKIIDGITDEKGIKQTDPEYLLYVSYIISYRFFHGFSHWNLCQNWIAAVGEKISGIGLACKVQPDAIMKDDNAGCSQQALVMMEIFRRKKINYRKLGFPHHYTLLAQANGKWYFLDPDMEPVMTLQQREFSSWKGVAGNIKPFYLNKSTKAEVDAHLGGDTQLATIGPINEVPAKNLRLFQNITERLSKILFIIPLLVWYYRIKKTIIIDNPEASFSGYRLFPA